MRALEKSHGDRAQAIRNVTRLYGVRSLEQLPAPIRALVNTTLAKPRAP